MAKRKTHEEFVEDFILKSENSDKIEILGTFTEWKTKIPCRCKICNHKWDVRPDALLRGSACPKCANLKKSLAYKGRHVEQDLSIYEKRFIEKFENANNHLELLGNYNGIYQKIKVRCKKHNQIWYGKPDSIIKGIGCKECRNEKFSQSNSKTQEEFEDRVRKINSSIRVIGKYTGCENHVGFKCIKCNYTWETTPTTFYRTGNCPKCIRKELSEKQTLSNKEFLRDLEQINKNIIPLEEYKTAHTKILFKCKIDGYEWGVTPSNILSGKGCPVCANKKVMKGVNDIATTHPHILRFLCDINDGYKYTSGSTKKLKVKCPDCGYIKEMNTYSLTSFGFSCDRCSDKISYPNKFIRGFIEQLDVEDITYEYNSSWTKLYRYDLYFKYGNINYLVEMDGGFHYVTTSMRTDEELLIQQQRDKEKDILAKENGFVLMRIDCRESNKDYIKSNILNSELVNIFDLSEIDWDLCDNYGQTNLIKQVCNFYNNSQKKSPSYIGEHFNLDRHTITKYLKSGANLGFCDYSVEKSIHQRRKETSNPVNVYDLANNIIHMFPSVGETSRKMNELYDEKFPVSSLRNRCKDQKPYKGFIFKYTS